MNIWGGMQMNPGPPDFRDNPCPKRGAGLTHTQDIRKFVDGRCIHCFVQLKNQPDPVTGPPSEIEDDELPSLINVAERLASLGFDSANPDGFPMEPRMISGNGPTGSLYGRGRGGLTMHDERRLVFNCLFARDGQS